MNYKVSDKERDAAFPALMEAGMGEFFDQWFDETLSFFNQEPPDIQGSIHHDQCQLLDSNVSAFKDISLNDSFLTLNSQPFNNTLPSYRKEDNRDAAKPMEVGPAKSLTFVQKGGLEARPIKSPQLHSFIGRNLSTAVSSRSFEEVPYTPPHTPHPNRTARQVSYEAGCRPLYLNTRHLSSSQLSSSSTWIDDTCATGHLLSTGPPSPPPSARVGQNKLHSTYMHAVSHHPSFTASALSPLPPSSMLTTNDLSLPFSNVDTYSSNNPFGWLEPSTQMQIPAHSSWDDMAVGSHFSPAFLNESAFVTPSELNLRSGLDDNLANAEIMIHYSTLEQPQLRSSLLIDQAGIGSNHLLQHAQSLPPPVPVEIYEDLSDPEDENIPRRSRRRTPATSRTQSTKAPKSRSRSQRLRRSNKSTKSLAKAAAAAAAPATTESTGTIDTANSGLDFVNFTASDSQKILTGVAPSGSSKTKARREREASERRRMLSEAATKAIRDAGGDLEELRRQGLLEDGTSC